MSDLDNISSSFEQKVNSIKSKEELQKLKTEFFGKNGEITLKFRSLGSIETNKRKEFASSLNKLKDSLTIQLEKKFLEYQKNGSIGAGKQNAKILFKIGRSSIPHASELPAAGKAAANRSQKHYNC